MEILRDLLWILLFFLTISTNKKMKRKLDHWGKWTQYYFEQVVGSKVFVWCYVRLFWVLAGLLMLLGFFSCALMLLRGYSVTATSMVFCVFFVVSIVIIWFSIRHVPKAIAVINPVGRP